VAAPAHWLALDQGGHASRAILYDAAGGKVDEAFAPIGTRRDDAAARVEHDPEELIGSLRAAIDEVCARAAAAGRRIAAAGLATQRSSMACWHRRTGAALSPVISWQDRRNAAWLERLEPRRAWIRERTGLVLTPHYGASKMRWCLDHLPEVQAAAAAGVLAMGPLASFIAFRLARAHPLVADPANASRTQLVDARTADWSDELLALFGIPRAALPRCVTSRHDYGLLDTPAGAVPLVVVTGDQSAVPFAFGPLDPAAAYVNVGTGAFAQRAVHGRMPEAPRLLASVVWSDAGGVDYMLEGTVNGAGSALDWLAAREGVEPAPLLESLERHPDSREPPLFLNGVSGLGAPFWDAGFESRFVVQEGDEGDRESRFLAVIESIAFLLRVNLDELAPHGPPLRRIVLTGGLSASGLFSRRLASLCGVPVWRSREAEATARGLAWLVATGPRPEWSPGPGEEIAPRVDPALAARYARWRAAMPALPASPAQAPASSPPRT
jgi:glycerol kinase